MTQTPPTAIRQGPRRMTPTWTSNGRPVSAKTTGPLFVSARVGEGLDMHAEDLAERYRRMREMGRG